MTAPDVRTAAQAEAEANIGGRIAHSWFVDGAVWGAERVTPTREQIADALWGFPVSVITLSRLNELAKLGLSNYSESRDYVYAQADAVLALMNHLTERNH